LQKVEVLQPTGARITLIAPWACDALRKLAAEGAVQWTQAAYSPELLRGADIVIAATDDAAVNHAVYTDAKAAGLLANAVDDPPFCDFYFGATVRRGPLQIAISTAGESPSVAQRLRREIDAALAPDTGRWLRALGRLRRQVLGTHSAGAARNRLLQTLAGRDVCDEAHCPARQIAAAPVQQVESWWLT
jgi:siroheme synthase-like protein